MHIYIHMCICCCFIAKSRLTLGTLWTMTCQAPLSVEFPRQEYWSGLPFPPPEDLPHPGIELSSPMSSALQADSLPTEPFSSVQFSSVTQSCQTLCDPMNRSMPGLPEFTQTHVHQVSDAIQPSHPLSSPSPPAPNPSQYQSLFQ